MTGLELLIVLDILILFRQVSFDSFLELSDFVYHWRVQFNCVNKVCLNHALFHEICVLDISMKLIRPNVLNKEENRHQGFEINFEIG